MAEPSRMTKSEMRRRKKRKRLIVKIMILVVLLLVLAGALAVLAIQMRDKKSNTKPQNNQQDVTPTAKPGNDDPNAGQDPEGGSKADLLAKAELQAAQYDYDAALETLKNIPGAQEDTEIVKKIADIQQTKDSCVAVNMNEVTHIFYHSLVVDPDRGFAGNDQTAAGFKQWMTTVDEFNAITQAMYDKGYVLVRLRDLVEQTVDADGTVHFKEAKIMLPPGKKAFVLSLDDLSYYHSYEGRGIASKMVLDGNGKPVCEYKQADGTTVTGAYDCVPLLDKFIEEHPDASYRGAKGIIALTGYNGILGYRTDGVYDAAHNTDPERYYLDKDQTEWLNAHPDFNWEQECEQAKKVAEAMKADGWEFASHTWGHMKIGTADIERIKRDTQRFKQYVDPLIGGTDTIIFAHGQDLAGSEDYSTANEKFTYLKSQGYNFYCNVDSTQYWLQIRDNYLRMGRRNLDGYRLWYDAHGENKTGDLFDASQVLDKKRTDVPPLG